MSIYHCMVVHSEVATNLNDEAPRRKTAIGGLVSVRKTKRLSSGGWCPTCHLLKKTLTWDNLPLRHCSVCGKDYTIKRYLKQYTVDLLKRY